VLCQDKNWDRQDLNNGPTITFPNLGELNPLGSAPETLLLEFLGRVREAHFNRSLYGDEFAADTGGYCQRRPV